MRRTATVTALALAALLTGCGGGDDRDGQSSAGSVTSTTIDPSRVSAIVASYDLAANVEQSVKVGLIAGDGTVLNFGTVELGFAYMGTKEQPLEEPRRGPTATATWEPVAGQTSPIPAGEAATFVKPSDATGVYVADAVRFDTAGFWQVVAIATVNGERQIARAALTVNDTHKVVAPGEAAPAVENHLRPGGDVPAKAIDSRAADDGTVPDPELHQLTVRDAVATGKPTMVAISTPVYCVSRFCGPITDSVQKLASRYGDRMQFIHIEVWRDFAATNMNKAAAEWIYRSEANDINEPWVFVIDGRGIVTERFDNAVSDARLEAAVQRAIA